MPPDSVGIECAEAVLLSALLLKPEGWRSDEIRAALAGHTFRSNLHALLFSTLQQFSSAPGDDFPARVMAHLTRRGFPDVALEEFLRRPAPDAEAIDHALAAIRKANVGWG
jgi:hypothetical protein